MKRACDSCIRRKVGCDGQQPCQRCRSADQSVNCTYLTPINKRGPKTTGTASSKQVRRSNSGIEAPQNPLRDVADEALPERDGGSAGGGISSDQSSNSEDPTQFTSERPGLSRRIPLSVLKRAIDVYQSRMYAVWPVVDTVRLLRRLENASDDDLDAYVLATSLCAGTMAQLHISDTGDQGLSIDASQAERECTRLRDLSRYRERPSADGVLASFFLHVFHAKKDSRNTAMLFVQEAIWFARLLGFDEEDQSLWTEDTGCCDHIEILFLLLWVTERGYAIQHALPVSSHGAVPIPALDSPGISVHAQGLIQLASLFMAFDRSAVSRLSRYGKRSISKELLVSVEKAVADVVPHSAEFDIVRKADYLVTKQWMRILLWQQAMSTGLLSSISHVDMMTFLFPAQVAQDLLASMAVFSTENLRPLGRDQFLKFFEVANTLADVILCNPYLSERGDRRLGAADFLHGIYQTISPFLGLDPCINSMLREKTAEALIKAPLRFWALGSTMQGDDIPRGTNEGYVPTAEQETVDTITIMSDDEDARAMWDVSWPGAGCYNSLLLPKID